MLLVELQFASSSWIGLHYPDYDAAKGSEHLEMLRVSQLTYVVTLVRQEKSCGAVSLQMRILNGHELAMIFMMIHRSTEVQISTGDCASLVMGII